MKTEKGANSARAQEARQEILRLVQERGAGAQLPTVRALRDALGVSLSTLNAALAVLEEQGIISRRQGSGIFVCQGATQKHVALICDPEFLFGASPFWPLLIERATQRAAEAGHRLTLQFSGVVSGRELEYLDASPLPESLVRDITGGRVQGVLSLGLPHAATRWIEAQSVPVISFAGPSNYIVGQSQAALVQMAVAALARRGCRRIGLLVPLGVGEAEAPPQRLRELFEGALAAHDVKFDSSLVPRRSGEKARGASGVPSSVQQGFDLALRLFQSKAGRPDGVVITDDMMAQGVMMALDKLNVKVGGRLHIATHATAGSPVLLGWQERLIRLEFDPIDIVRTMLDTLAVLMAGQAPLWSDGRAEVTEPGMPAPPESHQFLPPRLILPEADF